MRDQESNRRGAQSHVELSLVELGGWFDHLAHQELAVVAAAPIEELGPRLALTRSTVSDLRHLGGSRAVHAARGYSTSPTTVPDAVAAGLSGTFAVRFIDPQHALSNADRQRIIATIWRAHPAPEVDLRTPDHDLSVFVTDGGLWFGERLAECAPELRRSAPRRPFVRSYETPPRKARVLVNLSGAGVDHLFLDPLCGTGALVIEAARVGSNSLGADLDRVAVTGAARNASHDGATAQFFVSDSRRAPLARGVVDAVATDLPYGRSASRRGLAGRQLYLGLLDALTATTALGARVVVMALADDTPKRPPAPWQLAWQCIEEARTVTRNIAIWRRT